MLHSFAGSLGVSLVNQISSAVDQQPDKSIACRAACRNQVLLATAIVHVQDAQGNIHACRALLDSASMSNFISEQLVSKLQLQQTSANVAVSGINEAQAHVSKSCEVHIESTSS